MCLLCTLLLLLQVIDEHGWFRGSGDGMSVYVGDSLGDLWPMIHSDIPIVMSKLSCGTRTVNRRLNGVAVRNGMKFVPLLVGALHLASKKANAKDDGFLYSSDSWSHIHQFLLSTSTTTLTATNFVPTMLTVAGSDSGERCNGLINDNVI